jgi:hypothetical protein
MRTFTDSTGQPWSVTINVEAVKRVKALCGVNLLDALGGELLEQLSSDPILLCDVLFTLCKGEAEAKKISDEAFGRGLAGDTIDKATDALLEELVEFFPLARRQLLRKALEKLRKLQTMAVKSGEENLDSDAMEQRMLAELQKGPGGSAGSLGASWASIPAPSPSGS